MENNTVVVYHLVTKQKMTLGQRIHFDNQYNQLYHFFLEKEQRNSNGEDFIQIMQNSFTSEGICLSEENSKVALKYVDQTIRAIREVVAEMVRLEEFTQYPSRLSCLFAAKNYEDVLKWKRIFDSYHRKVLQIVKLRVNGIFFEGDANLLPKENGDSFARKIEQARDYWNGNVESELTEILINGEMEVIEIIDNECG
jgi:hypothetical protein